MSCTFKVGVPAAPGSGATIDLFNSITMTGQAGRFRHLNITSIQILIRKLSHASAASGLKIYDWSDSAGAWTQLSMPDSSGTATMPVTVAALAAETNHHYSFVVDHLDDVRITYENSANVLTDWDLEITLTEGGAAVQK